MIRIMILDDDEMYLKKEKDITEPLGGSLADYGACYELLERMISSLVVILNEEELLC